jgi:aspartyl-tRNA(Asn)/glutamyl-tRNA(Gln) amidotransferase subunit C
MAFWYRLLDKDPAAPLVHGERTRDGEQGQDEDTAEESPGVHCGRPYWRADWRARRLKGRGRPAIAAPAMSVTHEQVRHIAKLARIAMSEEELGRLVPELNNILGWVEQLGEVNTDGVEPLTAVIEQKLRLRDDVVNDGNIRDEVLANAPEAQHGFFAVPKVIE